MSLSDAELGGKLRKLHALLGSANPNEREVAWAKIDELLAKHKKTWNDLPELLGLAEDTSGRQGDRPDDHGSTGAPPAPASLDLIRHILERHLHLTEHQLVAVTLWIAHTFVYQRFSITPRLVVTSPTMGCGKTTLLDIVSALGFKTHRTDNLTAPVLFRRIDRDRAAVLIDEGDNQDLPSNPTLSAVINSGHRHGGKIERCLNGEIVEFSTFAPLGFATIGTRLPLPTLHRSIVIRMERSSADLLRFDPKAIPEQQADCDTVYHVTFNWAMDCVLDLNPELPEGLRNRLADNWRVLISIADACSPEWGKAAREAAIALSKGQDEDLGVLLLSDIRSIFDRRPTADRLASAVIIEELNGLSDAPWSEWRGPRGDQTPRRLSQAQLAQMLAPFGIRPRTIWPLRRSTAARSAKGYLRRSFEAAWSSYCDGTPAQRNNVRCLDNAKARTDEQRS